MKLQFTRTVEDYVAFSKLLSKRSVKVRKRRWGLVIFIGFAVFLLLLSYISQPVLISLCLGILASVAFYLWLPLLGQSATRSTIKANKRLAGDMELVILPDGLASRKGHHEVKTFWEGVGEVVVEGEHTFIYIEEDTAHIIPHKRISADSYALFMQELAAHRSTHPWFPSFFGIERKEIGDSTNHYGRINNGIGNAATRLNQMR